MPDQVSDICRQYFLAPPTENEIEGRMHGGKLSEKCPVQDSLPRRMTINSLRSFFTRCEARAQAEFPGQRETASQRTDSGCAGCVGKGGRSRANARQQALRKVPSLVQTKQCARAKCVACPGGPGDVFGG